MHKTYSLKYSCENCGSVEDITMDFGTPASDIAECPHCGVKAAKKLPFKKPDMSSKGASKVGDRWLWNSADYQRLAVVVRLAETVPHISLTTKDWRHLTTLGKTKADRISHLLLYIKKEVLQDKNLPCRTSHFQLGWPYQRCTVTSLH